MPVGKYPNFDVCLRDQVKQGKSQDQAEKYCGYLEKKQNKSADFINSKENYKKIRDNASSDLSAKWPTARKNDLPDAAFAYVEPGGEKEKVNGKTYTKPRGKRHLPHHTRAVRTGMGHDTVDKSHLRNALARVNQTSIPSAAKASAQRHLARHAKALSIGDNDKKSKSKSKSKGK